MVCSRLRLVQPLGRHAGIVALCAAILFGVACVTPSARATLPVPGAAVVTIGPDFAAAKLQNGRVDVMIAEQATGSVWTITSSRGERGVNSVNLLTYGGETGADWNTFVYGTAVLGAARVELDWPHSVGGTVVDGAWLVVLPDKDMTPADLRWRFVATDGTELASGDGIVTLDP